MEKLLCVDHWAAELPGTTVRLPTNWLVERCVRFVCPGGTCAFHLACVICLDRSWQTAGEALRSETDDERWIDRAERVIKHGHWIPGHSHSHSHGQSTPCRHPPVLRAWHPKSLQGNGCRLFRPGDAISARRGVLGVGMT